MSSAPTPEDLGSIVPRRYQEEVFRRARQGEKSHLMDLILYLTPLSTR